MTTLSLVKFDGADGNTVFVDETSNQVWSPLGTARISNLESAFGGSSLRLDSVDICSVGTTMITSLVGDFTLEFFYKENSLSHYTEHLLRVSTSDSLKQFRLNTSNTLLTLDSDTGINTLSEILIYRSVTNWNYDNSVNNDGWNHIAICRKDNETRVFVNGTVHGITDKLTDDYSIINFGLGTGLNNGGSLNGNIDSIRVSDESIYNTNFSFPNVDLEILYNIIVAGDFRFLNKRPLTFQLNSVPFDAGDLDNSVVFLDGYGDAGGVVIDPDPIPTTTNIITGNVKKFGLPYSLQLVAVTVELIPEVVGSTTSDLVTGDYSIDVWPWTEETLIYAAPDYGDSFTPGAFIASGELVHPTVPNKNVYLAGADGTLGLIEPTWPDSGIIVSGTVTFTAQPLYRPLINGFIKPTVNPI